MMSRRERFRRVARALVASTLITGVTASALAAQEVDVAAVALSADNVLRDAPLLGGNIALRWRPGLGRFAYRIGAEWTSGDHTMTRVPCVGFYLPEACPPEPVRDDARLRSASLGASLRVLGRTRASLELAAELLAGSVRRESRGLSSGLSFSAEKRLWGGRLGAESRWQPWESVPFGVHAGLTYGQLGPFTTERLVEGYAPFDDGFEFRRIVLGASWSFAGTRR